MKTLLLLRHAKSSWDEPAIPDHDRPLAKRGKKDAPRMGRLLQEKGLQPDLVLCSTAKRARKTAKAFTKACGFKKDVQLQSEFYPGTPSDYLTALAALPGDPSCVLLVGHNPGMEDLLYMLTGDHSPMPTAALARVSLPISSWTEMHMGTRGQLEALWLPRDLP